VSDDLSTLLAELVTANDGDFAAAFRVIIAPDRQVRCVGIHIHGAPAVAALGARMEGMPYGNLEPSVGRLPPINKWDVRARGNLSSAWLGERVWDALGIGSQLGCLAIVGGRVWGWIGVLRWRDRGKPDYSEAHEKSARPGPKALLARVGQLDNQELPGKTGSFIVRDAQVIFSDADAAPWLVPERVAAITLQLGPPTSGRERHGWIDGAVYAATGMHGVDGLAWLVRIGRPTRILATSLLALPPMQRTVAEMAAAGATVKEIARAAGASENTIKTHIKRVYEACGVATRTELLELVRVTVPRSDLE